MQSANRASGKVTVGIVGLGNMGSRFAINLLKEGFEVVAFDVKRENIDKLSSLKAGRVVSAKSNAELARLSSIIFTILPTAESARAAILDDEDALVKGLGTGKTLVEMSSIDSGTMKQIAEKLPSGCDIVDATISGVEENVERREIVVMVAGESTVVQKVVKPVLERVTKAVVYVDQNVGSAKELKTATAMINAIQTMGIAEVLAWLSKRGVDAEALLHVMENSATNIRGLADGTRKILGGNFKPRTSWVPKDIGFGLKEAEDSGIPMPITSAVQQLFMLARAQDLAGYEAVGIARKVYEKIVDVKISKTE
jgi:3-hydroxyisobutyrate dehydrogenase-like beta-hydroxyacid dehydrogenase